MNTILSRSNLISTSGKMIFGVLLFVLWGMLGCKSTSENKQTDGGDDNGSVADTGAGTDVGVDGGNGQPAQSCVTGTIICGEEEICNTCTGRCTAEPGGTECPEGDINCRYGVEFCDPCTARCRPQMQTCDSCREDIECAGTGSACLDFMLGGRFCVPRCASTSNCPRCFTCEEVDLGLGQVSSLCLPLTGSCAEPCLCTLDRHCDAGFICGITGECVPGCEEDPACGEGRVCEDSRCVPACGEERQCPEGVDCREDGHCLVPGGCLSPRDCMEPQTYCDPDTRMCEPGCMVDEDCGAAQLECVEKECIQRRCRAAWECAYGEICVDGDCEKDDRPHCNDCDPQDEDVTECGGEPNICVTFQDEDGNDQGDHCLLVCNEADPDNECPQGFGCQELQDQTGASHGRFCTRYCPRRPIDVEAETDSE